MRLRRLVPTCTGGAALALAATAAAAQPAPAPTTAPAPLSAPALSAPAPGQDLRVRADWIEQCRTRISTGWGRRAFEADQDRCAAYYDDYYAYYARYAADHGYAQTADGMITVPVTFSDRPPTNCQCPETIEYEDAPVAARRVIRRPPPLRDKRIRIAPDKRLRSN